MTHIMIGERTYDLGNDGTLRKISPSPIMDGAEADAVMEVIRLRREWSEKMARFHVINYTEIPALNRQICERLSDVPVGVFSVRQLRHVLGPTLGATWENLREVALAAGMEVEVSRYDDLRAEMHRLASETRYSPFSVSPFAKGDER